MSKVYSSIANKKPEDIISRKEFDVILESNHLLIERLVNEETVIPDFDSFQSTIERIYHEVRMDQRGNVADYIPQLAKVAPDQCGVSICTIDGQVAHFGDWQEPFSVQSASKPLNYCLAVEENGIDHVHSHVGHEPSGRSFNEISLNHDGLPHNPLINSGAIMTCSLIKSKESTAERFEHILKTWKEACHSKTISFNNSIYLSEVETADRNYALAYFMRENNAFPERTNLKKTLELYFQCCSIEATTADLATLAATFANGGVCPFSGKTVFKSSTIRNCLSLMNTCGMYDHSGEFSFKVGIPAKSGVSGVVFGVIPNTMGICVWAPRINKQGNSLKALEFYNKLSEVFTFHNYDSLVLEETGKTNPRVNNDYSRIHKAQELCIAAAYGDMPRIKSMVAKGTGLNDSDYDGRTPLHLAVCEKRKEAIAYLLKHGADPNLEDRWRKTAFDEAVALNDNDILTLLGAASKVPIEKTRKPLMPDV